MALKGRLIIMKNIMKKGLKTFGCILLAVAIAMTGTHIPALETVTVAEAASPVVERAISWAIAIANDNSHGYSQSSRWGPDYDCSSLVISAFRNAGVDVGTAVTTRNMRSQFTQHGFQWIPWSQIGGTSNLQRGDILLNEQAHTEIYLGGNQNVGAHSNRGYPQTGDQTGTEVSVSGYYYHPWDGVLRYMGNDVCNCSTDYAADYYVSTNSLPLTMRSGHGTDYSIVTSIPKGSQVYVSRADGNWAHVEWNGYSGYCSMDYLTKITSKSYNLHVWVSNTGMGNVPSDFALGERYYICYELIDESTGKKANETSNIRYQATETVRNSKGKVFEHTYENSDYNWISVVCDSEDTYTGTVTISGDVSISCSVSFDVYAETVPEMKVWAWEDNDSNEIRTIDVGKTAYCSYLIRDQCTKKNLNDATVFWTKGEGYSVTIKVYDPNGTLVKTQSYKNNDCTWFSFVPDKIGEYKITATVTGRLSGGAYERIIKVEEKEHKYDSWKIIKKPTCTQTGTQTRTCTICKKIQTQTIAKIEHTYDSGIITKPAICIAVGTKTYTCIICGADKDETVPIVSHTLVKDDAVAPTYTEEGLTEGTHCSVCGKVITAQKIIPVMAHTPVVTESPKPTNTTDVVKDMEIVQEQEDVEESETVESPAVGTILKDVRSGILYKVLVPGRSVGVNGVTNRKIVKAVVPDTVVIDGIKYQVTKISNNAFSKCTKLKSVTIGKNVTSIGNNVFRRCRKLKFITLKSKKLKGKTVGTKAFKGMHKKAVIKVPNSRKKAYVKWLKKKGIDKAVIIENPQL